jgi:myo-inositol-1(or 4)-monophosphatase
MLGDPGDLQGAPVAQAALRAAQLHRAAHGAGGGGEFDAAVAPSRKHDWDVAAGAIIAEEAGARVTDHLGQRYRFNKPSPGRERWSAARPPCTR